MSKEIGQVYLERFRIWSGTMSDDDFRRIVYAPMGILNRQQIKKHAGLSDQAIKKNASVKQELKNLEDRLRARGVLPPLNDSGKKARAGVKLYDTTAQKSETNSERVAKLESSNHDLRARISELEKEVVKLRSRLASNRETVEAVKDGLMVFTQCPMS